MAAVATPNGAAAPASVPHTRSFVPIRPAFRPLLPKPPMPKTGSAAGGALTTSGNSSGITTKSSSPVNEPTVKLKSHFHYPQMVTKGVRKRKSETIQLNSTVSPASLMAKKRRNTEPTDLKGQKSSAFAPTIPTAKAVAQSATAPVSMAVGSPEPSIAGSCSELASSCVSPLSFTCSRASGATPLSMPDGSGFPILDSIVTDSQTQAHSQHRQIAGRNSLDRPSDSGLFSPASGTASMSSPGALSFEFNLLDFEVDNAAISLSPEIYPSHIVESAQMDSPPSDMTLLLNIPDDRPDFSVNELEQAHVAAEEDLLATAQVEPLSDVPLAAANWQESAMRPFSAGRSDSLNIDQLACDELATSLEYFSPTEAEEPDSLNHMDFLGQSLGYL